MIRRLAAISCLALLSAGCSDSTSTVDVFAASSLTDAFTELEQRFEADNPGIDIRLNLAGSDTLRRQIDDGAEAAVFAPASIDMFDGLDAAAAAYATNQLEVVVSADGTDVVDRLLANDLDGLLVARCTPGVPCGDAADRLIGALGLDLSAATVTGEANVRAVSAKVALGEADLGFVYRTDTAAADGAVTSTGLTSAEATVVLAIAALDSQDPNARAFVDFVLSEGDVFAALGFDPAP